jgi:hypothetical protein
MGRLMEGNEAQAAKLLDDYLDAADGAEPSTSAGWPNPSRSRAG